MNIHMSQQHQPPQPPDDDDPQPPPPQPLLPPTPIGCQQYQDPVQSYSLGPMNVHCSHCHALHFLPEKLSISSNANPRFGKCCLQGQVQLPPLSQPPLALSSLFKGSGQPQKQFRERIRQYNAAFAFTSIAAHINDSVLSGSGPYSFILHGSLHHKMGALLPPPGLQPSYAQLYVLDPDSATNARSTRNSNLVPSTMSDLHAMLLQHNPYVEMYKQAHQILREKPEHEQHHVRLCITVDPNTDLRRYNAPTVNEIAAIIPGGGEEHVNLHRDIILRLQGGGLTRISHLHHSYTPLHYVMLFPKGDSGFHVNIPSQFGPDGKRHSKYITQRCYYAYRALRRPTEPDILFYGGKLFQQYLVDAWVSIEESNLYWVRTHQKQIRADLYQGLQDAIHANQPVNLAQQGQRIVLPSTHQGSTRHMYQLFQDSMAICRYGRKPDLFITMTANPNWPDIQAALLQYHDGSHQAASDRPDIVARVFDQKKDALLHDIIKGRLFGEVAGSVYTIEFQKRGLPHMHLLIFLKPAYKIHDSHHADAIVHAQIPDPVLHPKLHDCVTKYMLHGPCGPEHTSAACMEKDPHGGHRCTKRFPKDFCQETSFGGDGYPEYARPNNGRSFSKQSRGQLHVFTNKDVVPYNPLLLARYDCHINVEVCASIKAVKYIHKYIYKGPDRATVQVGNVDEIKDYIDAHYVGPAEACWHIFECHMHQELPTVYRLSVHLENQQMVYFQED